MKSTSKIAVSLFTSGTHTQSLIKALKAAKNIQLVNIYSRLPSPQQLAGDKAGVFLVADFGQIVPKKLFSIPPHGWLVIHPSLLPQYRGASPVQAAIINGDQETGVTIIKIHPKVDYGPIVAQFKEAIKPHDTAGGLYQRLFGVSGEVLTTILPAWVEGKIKPRQQNHTKATYTPRLTRDDGQVDWQKSDQAIERFIRAMSSWPEAWTEVKLSSDRAIRRLKILAAHLEKNDVLLAHRKAGSPGRIARLFLPASSLSMERRSIRRCENKLVFDQVQLEGKKPVSWKQFCEGYPKAKIVGRR